MPIVAATQIKPDWRGLGQTPGAPPALKDLGIPYPELDLDPTANMPIWEPIGPFSYKVVTETGKGGEPTQGFVLTSYDPVQGRMVRENTSSPQDIFGQVQDWVDQNRELSIGIVAAIFGLTMLKR